MLTLKFDKLNIGCDPEFFACYTEEKKGPIADEPFVISPAFFTEMGFPILGGNAKHPVYIRGEDFRFVGDGAAFELNMLHPYKSSELAKFYADIQAGIQALETYVHSAGYGLYKKPVVNFDYKTKWDEAKMRNPIFYWGTIFGCDPDKDAFDVKWLAKIKDASKHPYRYGGGHWHLSGIDAMAENIIPFVKLLAIFVGNFCIANSPYPELESLRAKYYGKPGKYRLQNYPDGSVGVEYRTPSNAWCSFEYEKLEQMLAMVELAISALLDPVKGKKLLEDYSQVTVEAITTADPVKASQILSSVGAL